MAHSDLLRKQVERLKAKYPDDETVLSMCDTVDDLSAEEEKAEEVVEELLENLEEKGEEETVVIEAVEPIEESVEVEPTEEIEHTPEPEAVFEVNHSDESPSSGHWLYRDRW